MLAQKDEGKTLKLHQLMNENRSKSRVSEKKRKTKKQNKQKLVSFCKLILAGTFVFTVLE